MPRFTYAICMTLYFIPFISAGQTVPENARAKSLQDITWTADQLCTRAATGGTSWRVNASATVQAELDKLLKRLVKLGVNTTGAYQAESHEGVLANEVLAATKQADGCKLHVFDLLVERMIPKPPQSMQTSYGKNSPNVETLNGSMVINDHGN
ncbi:hypothetical protein [Luteibacter sp. 9135]|uniref:hypothetical protein n=1 Tax=Luteibacter sp. 9135 TaxID=1500893 RepID=UPI00055D4F61|nr:hypothetical protein [Luteibacter sp. 9135]